jgi:hypothetical protein
LCVCCHVMCNCVCSLHLHLFVFFPSFL